MEAVALNVTTMTPELFTRAKFSGIIVPTALFGTVMTGFVGDEPAGVNPGSVNVTVIEPPPPFLTNRNWSSFGMMFSVVNGVAIVGFNPAATICCIAPSAMPLPLYVCPVPDNERSRYG